jgi:hypothetical protein
MWSKLPVLLRMRDAKLIFNPEKDGYSIRNIYRLNTEIENNNNIIFIIQTEEDEVFGGYLSSFLKLTGGKFIKPFDSILFSIRPNLEVYSLNKNSENILLCENSHIMYGNGENGPAIYISEDLGSGRSNPGNCFCKEKLVNTEDGNFKIARFEVYLLE